MSNVIEFTDIIQLEQKPLTKKELQSLAQNRILDIEEAGEFSLENLMFIKRLYEYSAAALKRATVAAKDKIEAEYSEAEVKAGIKIEGAEITITKGFDLPDLESDPAYCELKAKLKTREDFLKLAFKSPNGSLDSDTGELVKPPAKSSRGDTLKIQF